jgi:hypothetical protein
MKVSQFIIVPVDKVQVIQKAFIAVVEVLVVIKWEVMVDITVARMLPKAEPSVLGVMTNGKPKLSPIKVFESNDD